MVPPCHQISCSSMWQSINANRDPQAACAGRSLQWGKTPGELVPRSGNNEQLINMLRGAVVENPSSRASVVSARSFHAEFGLDGLGAV